MVDVIVVYDTISGTTEQAAEKVLAGVKRSGADGGINKVEDVTVNDLREARGIILGSPCISDNISGRMREFVAGKLKDARVSGKVGAAFGTHKWNGGNLPRLEAEMHYEGIRLVASGVNARHRSTTESDQALMALGEAVGHEVLRQKRG